MHVTSTHKLGGRRCVLTGSKEAIHSKNSFQYFFTLPGKSKSSNRSSRKSLTCFLIFSLIFDFNLSRSFLAISLRSGCLRPMSFSFSQALRSGPFNHFGSFCLAFLPNCFNSSPAHGRKKNENGTWNYRYIKVKYTRIIPPTIPWHTAAIYALNYPSHTHNPLLRAAGKDQLVNILLTTLTCTFFNQLPIFLAKWSKYSSHSGICSHIIPIDCSSVHKIFSDAT